jgi:hypothetical protein
MNESRKRHRWETTGDHWYPGPKGWRCVQCGLLKVTEWQEKPLYRMPDGRTWHRFAPPCPPDGGGPINGNSREKSAGEICSDVSSRR